MKLKIFNREYAHTPFIQLNTQKCKACWKCLNICKNNVFGKIDFLGHRHSLIKQPDKCTGCLRCLNVCDYGAITKISKLEPKEERQNKGILLSFIINLTLLIVGMAVVFSGFVIQFNYHMGHRGIIITTDKLWGLNYYAWSNIHKTAITVISFLIAYHIALHWKWYKNVISKNLIAKSKQPISFAIIFILVAVIGYIAWIIQLTDGSGLIRKLFLEIHDKLAIILFVYLVLHVVKKVKWFTNTYKRIGGSHK